MNNLYLNLLLILTFIISSCSKSPVNKAHSSVESYLKENLKNPSSYEPLYFSLLEPLKQTNNSDSVKLAQYQITHFYNIINSDKDIIKMTVNFYLDKDYKVIEASTKSINGEYGSMTGNAYWKYNNYIGNKPDAGSEVILYSLDTIRGDLKFETTTDVQGNYRIDKIPTGKYFLFVRSKNATDCPDSHLRNLRAYSSYLKQLFGFDLNKYSNPIKEILLLDSLSAAALTNSDDAFGSAAKALDGYYKYQELSRIKANDLFKLFPDDFKLKIKLFTGYSNAYDFETIYIEEGRSVNQVTDFGVTCI